MTTQPNFASAAALVGTGTANATADTSYTAPTNYTALTWSTAIGASGAKISEIDLIGTGTTVNGVINIFLYDGTNFHVVDSITVPIVTASTTAGVFVFKKTYAYLFIPTTWTIRFTSTVANQLIEVNAYGGNF
jgi:hypothetical protein